MLKALIHLSFPHPQSAVGLVTICLSVLVGSSAIAAESQIVAPGTPPPAGRNEPPDVTQTVSRPAPRAVPSDEIFARDPSQTIYDEIERIPFDNKLKYSALIALTMIPKTSLVGVPALKSAILIDIAVATAQGTVNALDLTAKERALAKARIAVLKGTGNWTGFLNDLSGIKQGVDVAKILAVLPSTVSGLLAGNEALRTSSDVGFYLIETGKQFGSTCEFDAAREVYREARSFFNSNIPTYAINASNTYAAMRNQAPPENAVPEELPRALRPWKYDQTLQTIYGERYLYWIKEYDNANALLDQVTPLERALEVAERDHRGERKELAGTLKKAERLLWDCKPEQGIQILTTVKGKYLAERLTQSPAKPKVEGCFNWAAKEYDRVNGQYYEFSSGMIKTREQTEKTLKQGLAALKQCRVNDADEHCFGLGQLLLGLHAACSREAYKKLSDEIDRIKTARACDRPPKSKTTADNWQEEFFDIKPMTKKDREMFSRGAGPRSRKQE